MNVVIFPKFLISLVFNEIITITKLIRDIINSKEKYCQWIINVLVPSLFFIDSYFLLLPIYSLHVLNKSLFQIVFPIY